MVNFRILSVAATLIAGAVSAPSIRRDGTFDFSDSNSGDVIPGSYVVMLKPGIKASAATSHINWVKSVHKRAGSDTSGVSKTYTGQLSFQGYAGHFDDATVAEIKKSADVAHVEEDKVVDLAFLQEHNLEPRLERALTTETNATWGLGTISHRHNGTTDYIYDTAAGSGTYAYIIDTGLLTTHEEFGGRGSVVYTAFPGITADDVGHGTHVAGTIGGITYGVAKNAQLLSVKAFQGTSSSTSDIMAGFNFAANDIITKGRTKSSVINMSFALAAYSLAFNTMVQTASAFGILSCIAAGNDAIDASGVSPASASSGITVGAINTFWNLADYSNYGSAVDILNPGTNITSAWIGSNTATFLLSGTSMATPHTVGLALYAISVDGITGVGPITNHIKSTGTKNGITTALKGCPNLIGNNGNSQE